MVNDFYPESMYKTVVVNAPAWMTIAWDMIKPMLDPRTKAKVRPQIFSSHRTRSLAANCIAMCNCACLT